MPAPPVIDAALVRQLVRAQFPQWAHLPISPVADDGWDNRTFRIGADLTARLPSAIGYEPQVRKELVHLPTIAAGVSLPVPEIVALGLPGRGFPFEWTVRRWIPGTPARGVPDLDRGAFAADIAAFLRELRAIDAGAGPPPGPHGAGRGGPLEQWNEEVAATIAKLGDRIDGRRAMALWAAALGVPYDGEPIWFHGDVATGNLLTLDGRLSAVIDFGCSGVGDPACDLVIAWTFLDDGQREGFREAVALDDAEWRRGVGWALWKALITVDDEREASASRFALEQLRVR